jgi:predicted GH43/DUF377 family glycosyl hydrolase
MSQGANDGAIAPLLPFANDKLGPAAPPVLTDRGWLVVFLVVDRDDSRGRNGWEPRWTKRYTAGVCLLDRRSGRRSPPRPPTIPRADSATT